MTDVKFGRTVEEEFITADQLHRKAILFDENDIGKLTICSNESLDHFMAKAILMYNLLRLRHRVVCEAKIIGVGNMDVFDIDTNVNYEIERSARPAVSARLKEKYRSAGIDLVIIPINHLGTDLGAMNEFLRKWIRPD